jgi:hypothetical protein
MVNTMPIVIEIKLVTLSAQTKRQMPRINKAMSIKIGAIKS